jgi:cyclopropane fatty-acyl-phospholipid synthase-like methyltransferase
LTDCTTEESFAVDDPQGSAHQELTDDSGRAVKYYDREFWSQENLRYAKPHFRLEKAARIVNRLAHGKQCELLDVGCGPATLARFLSENISYYGIDMAIGKPSPNLQEADLVKSPIRFGDKRFDFIVAQGFFEYVGTVQEQKFAEIADLLTDDGKFLATYVNFGHRDRQVYWPYSNVQPLPEFRASLARHFTVERSFPTSHNWNHSEPNRQFMRVSQMPVMTGFPIISRLFGVEYFFLCSRRPQ